MVASIERGEALLRISQALLRGAIPSCICNEVGRVVRAGIRKHILVIRYDLQILMLLCQILVLNHHLTDWGFLRKVQPIDTLIEQFAIQIVEADDYLRADGL